MKCSKCGHRANSIKAMGDHYRKKHPSSMKAKKARKTRVPRSFKKILQEGHSVMYKGGVQNYCPHCGGRL